MEGQDDDVVLSIESSIKELPFSGEENIPLQQNAKIKKRQSIKGPTGDLSEVDSPNYRQSYASKKNVAEGMMDIALLTANANQLRFLITFNTNSPTFYISFVLIVASLILQVVVGIALIFKRQMKNRGKKSKIGLLNDFLVGGVFLITIINVFVASFTTTEAKVEPVENQNPSKL